MQVLGAGLLITVTGEIAPGPDAVAGRGGGGGGGFGGRGPANVAARLHIDRDGTITVHDGQGRGGARLAGGDHPGRRGRIAIGPGPHPPDHGRHGPGARRRHDRRQRHHAPDGRPRSAAGRPPPASCWSIWPRNAGRSIAATLRVRDGAITHEATNRTITYAELAQAEDFAKTLARPIPGNVAVTPVNEWKVLGTSVPRPKRRDIVTGAHHYPSDIVRPGMLYGKILRPPSFGATLDVDRSCAGPGHGGRGRDARRLAGRLRARATSLEAQRAVEALAKTAKWQTKPQDLQQGPFRPFPQDGRRLARRRVGGRSGEGKNGPSRKLRGRLYPACADGAAGRRGRVERRQAHRVDGHPEPLRRPRRVGRRA